MGIPSYFSFIVKNHPNIIRKYIKNNFPIDNLFLDCNSIIYDIYNTSFKNEPFHEELQLNLIHCVISKIKQYIEIFGPQKLAYIAFDGVAPVAKLNQQRERRYKSWYQNEISKKVLKNTKPDVWNTTAITPGTTFMKLLNETLYKQFKNSETSSLKIIVTGSDEVGEGEHKIFEYIRQSSEIIKNDTNVIYGLDADLIMLSINHLPFCKKMYLIRESPHFIQSLNKDMDPNENYIMDIPELTKEIIQLMNSSVKIENNQMNKNKIYDYIFICFLLGNDFMPHFPSINIRRNGIDKLIDAYRNTLGQSLTECLTDGSTIYWTNVKKMLVYLEKMEHPYIIDEYKYRNRHKKNENPNPTDEEKLKLFDLMPMYERDDELFINPFKPYWENRYYMALFGIKEDVKNTTKSTNSTTVTNATNTKKHICINYLEGLEWVMKYYTSGCVDWRWKYTYHYPPLLKDLVQYIPLDNHSFFKTPIYNPVNSLTLLCYVLPKSSLDLIPNQLFNELIKQHSSWYSDNWNFKWSFCRYFWESHVVMNDIHLEELELFLYQNKDLLK